METQSLFKQLTKKKPKSFQRFKTFRRFQVFVLNCRANSKRRERRKILKISFEKQINDWSAFVINQIDHAVLKSPESWTWSEISSAEDNKSYMADQLKRITLFGFYWKSGC